MELEARNITMGIKASERQRKDRGSMKQRNLSSMSRIRKFGAKLGQRFPEQSLKASHTGNFIKREKRRREEKRREEMLLTSMPYSPFQNVNDEK
jgi:hypothetical protein